MTVRNVNLVDEEIRDRKAQLTWRSVSTSVKLFLGTLTHGFCDGSLPLAPSYWRTATLLKSVKLYNPVLSTSGNARIPIYVESEHNGIDRNTYNSCQLVGLPQPTDT